MKLRDANCSRCVLSDYAGTVCLPGRGPTTTEVMIVGEAPGEEEDRAGKPFVGKSGQLLDELLRESGLIAHKPFITNAVKCRPPDNRKPKPREIEACSAWMVAELKTIKPKYVLLLGAVALNAVLGETGIKQQRGRVIERDGIIYLPTYHPAFILRDPSQRATVLTDLRALARLVRDKGKPSDDNKLSLIEVEDEAEFIELLAEEDPDDYSLDLETTGLYPWMTDGRITSFGIGTSKHQYVWLNPTARGIARIRQHLPRECEVYMQNGKFDSLWLRVWAGVDWKCTFDTMLCHYLLDENSSHSLDNLAARYFAAPPYDVPLAVKHGKDPDWRKLLPPYHARDLYYTYRLAHRLREELSEDPQLERFFRKVMMPAARMFVEVEHHGVFINSSKFEEAERYLRGQLAEAEQELNKHAQINWGSTKQLSKFLFEDLGITPLDLTAKGNASTSESVLLRLSGKHRVCLDLIKYRAAKQQLSFFIDGWKPFLVDSRLHPSFKLHGTVTGRLSCENPNLQQVPRDKRIRSLIHAPRGWELVEADLSQIELRIAAELSGDRQMLLAFQTGLDVHWLTAMRELHRSGGMSELILETAKKLEGKTVDFDEACDLLLKAGPDASAKIDDRWKELRKKAKAINFGYLYGMWWKKFILYARDNYGVEVTDREAQASREAYFTLYADLPKWHERQRRFVRSNGYVRSLSGRKRRLPAAKNQGGDSEDARSAERQAINSPVQGFASDLNLMAALELTSKWGPRDLHLVGTVHDALLMEVRKPVLKAVVRDVLQAMRHPPLLDVLNIKLRVPVLAEVKIGPWGAGLPPEEYFA